MTNRASDFHGHMYYGIPNHGQGEGFAQVPINNFENEEYVQFHHEFHMRNVPDFNCFAQEEPIIKRKRWKKPEGMPKRPQSAYNLFFQLERARLLDNEAERKYTKEDVDRIADQQREKRKQPFEKRKHRKTHGKIGFGDLARTIANTWKAMDAADKVIFEQRAAIEKKEYIEAVEKWNVQQCQERKVDIDEPSSDLMGKSKSLYKSPSDMFTQRESGYGSKTDDLVHGGARSRLGAWQERQHLFHVDSFEPNGHFRNFESVSRRSNSVSEIVPNEYVDNLNEQPRFPPPRRETRNISFSYMRRRLPYRFYFGSRSDERAATMLSQHSPEFEQIHNSYENDTQTSSFDQRSPLHRTNRYATNCSNGKSPSFFHYDSPAANFASNRIANMQFQPVPVEMQGPNEHVSPQRSGASNIGSTTHNESCVATIEGLETPEEEYQMSVLLKSFDRGDL
jgi:hypothetical protein